MIAALMLTLCTTYTGLCVYAHLCDHEPSATDNERRRWLRWQGVVH